jgi:MarR family transcriptional regulator, organic hydroperoxide resistance regulator
MQSGTRANRVALTARGRDLQAPLDREMDQMNQDLLGEFPPEERNLMRNLLMILAGWKQAPSATNANSRFEGEADHRYGTS